jgi:hypothetical protein
MVAEQDGLASLWRVEGEDWQLLLAEGEKGQWWQQKERKGSTYRSRDGRVNITNITMADEDNNRFESIPKWIEWNGLNDGESLPYCQRFYLKPEDEEDLKKKIKDKIKQSDERQKKRLAGTEPKRSRVKYSDEIERVENHKKWIEWINLVSGGLTYKGRIYKKEVPNHGEQLMTRIIGTMDYNRLARERREVAKAVVDMGRGGEERNDGGITTSNNGEDDDNDCKLAAKPMVVDNGGKEGVEEPCTALNNVVIKEWDARAVAGGGRDNNNFEGVGND